MSDGPVSDDAWLRELPESVPVAVTVSRRTDGMLLYANRRFAALLGTSVEEALGKSLLAFYADAADRDAMIADLARDGEVHDREVRAHRADGTPLWVAVSLRPIAYRGRSDTLLASFYDITDRKSAQQALSRQAAALAQMAEFPEVNPGPVARIERGGRIVLANAAARRLFGDEHLVGRSWPALCPGLTPETWQRVLDGSEPLRHEAEVGGRWITFAHLRSRDDQLVFVYGADITDRRRAESLLAEQAAALAEMAKFPEMNPGPVVRCGLDGGVLLANAKARSLFGGDNLIGRSWRDLCPGMDRATWDRVVATPDLVMHECAIGEAWFVFAHRLGPERRNVFIFGADITALRTAERALRQSEKMATLGTLAAGVAHELNNPAASVRRGAEQLRAAFSQLQQAYLRLAEVGLSTESAERLPQLDREARARAAPAFDLDALTRSDREAEMESWLEDHDVDDAWELAPALVGLGHQAESLGVLTESFSDDELPAVVGWLGRLHPVHSLIDEIGQGAGRISEIVKALKSYSYLGQAPVQAVDLREGLDNTLVILRNKLKVGIVVHRDYDPTLPPVQAWGSELNQVWTNLLDNAADAMGGRGEIAIRTRRDGAWAEIIIEDNGPGIPEAVQSRVFDPFYTTKAPGHGTGLGLSTSYNIIVKQHKGEIRVESRPGRTCFIVRLPLENASSAPAEEAADGAALESQPAKR